MLEYLEGFGEAALDVTARFTDLRMQMSLPVDSIAVPIIESGFLTASIPLMELELSELGEDVVGSLVCTNYYAGVGIRVHSPWHLDPFIPFLEVAGGLRRRTIEAFEIGVLGGSADGYYVHGSLGTILMLRFIPWMELKAAGTVWVLGSEDVRDLGWGWNVGFSYRF